MVNSPPMSTAPVAVIDALNALLEAEMNSIFRFMGEGSPYLSRATAEIRKPLNDMVQASQRHASELAGMIEHLGGIPSPRGSVQPEEQYLAFLSLKFLLPKLADAKKLTVERYENSLRAIKGAPAEVSGLLKEQLNEHKADLQLLQKAASDVVGKKL